MRPERDLRLDVVVVTGWYRRSFTSAKKFDGQDILWESKYAEPQKKEDIHITYDISSLDFWGRV